jgi:hypothetical protein
MKHAMKLMLKNVGGCKEKKSGIILWVIYAPLPHMHMGHPSPWGKVDG